MGSSYYINDKDEFIIEDYNQKKPFSSFLPAVAGLYGKPMWAYYVNRGQCMATFGVNNKDYSIMEFQPANKAYCHILPIIIQISRIKKKSLKRKSKNILKMQRYR